MASLISGIAAQHGGVWSFDPWYRVSWYAAPLATAVLLSAWIVGGTPAPVSAPWGKPAESSSPPPAPAQPGNSSQPAQGSAQSCTSNGVDVGTGVTACTSALSDNSLTKEVRSNLLTRRAYLYSRQGKKDLEMADYNEAIRVNPDNYWTYSNRSAEWLERNDIDRALADANKSISLNTNYATAWMNRGDAYYRRKQYDPAISDLTQAIRIDANAARPYFLRARAHYDKELYDAALRDFADYVKRNPSDMAGLRWRGLSYAAISRLDDAVADYNEALRNNPSDANALGLRANAYYRKSDYNQAIRDANEALRNNPNYTYANQVRGRANFALGNLNSAIPDFNVALKADPSVLIYQERGRALAGTGAYDSAARDYEEAERLAPRSGYTQYLFGIITERRELERVKRCMAGPSAMRPEDYARSQTGGDICPKTPDLTAAIARHTKSIELDGNFAPPYFERSRMLMSSGQLERARIDADAGLGIDSRSVDGHLAKGNVASAQNRIRDAIAEYSTAITLNPKSSTAFSNRGQAYLKLNDRPNAIADLRTASTLDPNNEYVKDILRSLGQR